MVIYPNTVKRQGSLTAGIITLIIAVIIAIIGVVVAIYLRQNNSHFFYVPIFFASIMSTGGLVFGTINVVKGIKGRAVMRDGYKGSCEIVSIRYSSASHDTTGPYMIVKYISESNTERLLRVALNYKNAYRLRLGMKIECYIHKETCYVDTREEIRILEAPEEMSIKDTFKSLFKDTKQVPFYILKKF